MDHPSWTLKHVFTMVQLFPQFNHGFINHNPEVFSDSVFKTMQNIYEISHLPPFHPIVWLGLWYMVKKNIIF